MKAFRVKGKFFMGKHWQEFTKELAEEDEKAAQELLYSRLGSKHRVKRAKIMISEVTEIPIKDVTDPITKYKLQNIKKKTKAGEKNG
jgi:large subunit ribosomal protein LX